MVVGRGAIVFKMGVHHMGSYSCEDSTDSSVLQVHSVKVQSRFSVCVHQELNAGSSCGNGG